MRRSQSVSRFPGENNSKRKSDLTGSLSIHSASGWFNRGKVNNRTSPSTQRDEQKNAEWSTLTASSRQQARVQEIAQSPSLEQRFLSKIRESGVVTSAGYQAVLLDCVAGDRIRQTDDSDAAAATENIMKSSATTSKIIDRRAEMHKTRKSSSRTSSSGWGSGRRFSSFFTACSYSHDDEDLAFGNNDAPETSVADRRAEMLNGGRQTSSRRGSRRLFGSFFTAVDDDDFSYLDNSNRVDANIAPLRRSATVQSTQEAIECNQLVADEYDDSSHRWSITSSLSDSIHVNSKQGGDEGDRERLEKHDRKKSDLQSRGSNTSLNLEENCQKQDHSSDQAAEAKASANTRRNFTASVNFDPAQSTKNAASKSEEEEASVEQDSGTLEASESFCNLDDCAWLPWPERRECIIEDKDNESCASGQPLYDDNSFLPWPDSPRNGRALAA